MKLRALVVVIATAVMAIQGCASGAATTGDPARMVALFRDYQADYIVMERPADLAEISHLVVVGRLTDVREGRVWQVPDVPWSRSTTVIVAVETEQVLGGASAREDSVVYAELENPSRLPVDVFTAALPTGSRVLLYGSRAGSTKNTPDIASSNGNEAIDSRLYLPVSPQGLAVAVATGVAWPMMGVTTAGSLEESFPDGRTLPREE